jgi:hypothetical protein
VTQFLYIDATATPSRGAFSSEADNRVERKLKIFSALARGWHYGEGDRIADATLDLASQIRKECLFFGFTNMDAFPGAAGEVMLTVYLPQRYIEIIITAALNISLLYERNDEEVTYAEGLTPPEARAGLKKVAGELWSTFATSTLNSTMIRREGNSKVLHFGEPQGTGEYRLLRNRAWTLPVTTLAHTPEGSTPSRQESRRSSGSSTTRSSLKRA